MQSSFPSHMLFHTLSAH